MGKAKRFNSYDNLVEGRRSRAKGFGETRQKFSGINSSFLSAPINPPIATKGRGGSTGTGTGKFLTVSLSADQTTNIGANDHVEFDTKDEDGSLVLQTGAGQADGIIELESGKKYFLSAQLRPEFSGATGQLVIAWYDRTNSAEIGSRAIYESQTHASHNANQPTAEVLVTPSTNITVEVRIIAVTALTALANEYCTASLFEIALGGSGGAGGAGGSVSFPITPTINDHGSVGTTTEDINLSAEDGHIHKITMTGNPTLTFSNPPSSGTQIEFEIEFVQDGTGGRTVTFPGSVAETVILSSSANSTTIVTFRTNDGGTTYHAIPALRGAISLTGAFLPLAGGTMTGNIVMGSNDITGIDNLKFATTGSSDASASTIWTDSSGDMILNVATGDDIQFRINNLTEFSMNASEFDVNNNEIIDVKGIDLQDGGPADVSTGSTIWSDASGDMVLNVASGDVFFFTIAGTTEFRLTSSLLDINDKEIIDVKGIDFQNGGPADVSTASTIWSDASGDMVFNVASGDSFFYTIAGTTHVLLSANDLELRSTTSDTNDITLNYNANATANDVIGKIVWESQTDGGVDANFAIMEVEVEDPANAAKQGQWKLSVQHDNTLAPILDYTGDDAVFRFSSGVDVVRPNRDDGVAFGSASQSWADSYFANFLEIKEMTAPSNPPANSGRLYVADNGSGTTVLYFLDSAGTTTNVLSAGATTALDNLASVAINTSLISDTDNTDDLGSALIEWKDLYIDGTANIDTLNVDVSVGSDLIPTDGTKNLGNSSVGWNNIYSDNTLFCSNFKVWIGDSDINVFNDLDMQAGNTVDYADNSTVPGGAALGAIVIKVNGVSRKVKFYA